MAGSKSSTLNLRIDPDVKDALRAAAEGEHRFDLEHGRGADPRSLPRQGNPDPGATRRRARSRRRDGKRKTRPPARTDLRRPPWRERSSPTPSAKPSGT